MFFNDILILFIQTVIIIRLQICESSGVFSKLTINKSCYVILVNS